MIGTLREAGIRHFVNPVIFRHALGSRRFEYCRLMNSWQWDTLEKNRERQKKSLYELVKYSGKNVPYYRKLIKERKIKFSKDTILEDLRKFPPLTKEDLRKNFSGLFNPGTGRKWHKDTSGGSTGEPVVIYHDQVFSDWGAGAKILFNSWAGKEEGELMIKLWGSERDILEGGEGLRGLFVRHGMNAHILNTFRMSEKDMFEFVRIINRERPKMILGYVQSIYELSRFISEKKLEVYSPKGLMTSAGTLYPKFKKLISEAFRCPVYNRYGSREVGDMACNCSKDEGLHTNIFNHHIEILNKRLMPCKPGESGTVYVTCLHNQVMPLIRYEIGDIAIPAKKERCSCGRGLPLIEKISGRDVNLFKTSKGDIIDGEYFTHMFYFRNWVRRFQVVQKDYDLIRVKIVLNPGAKRNPTDEKYIEYAIRKVMGPKCRIDWEFPDEIQPTKSGKFLYTISKIK